MTYECLVCIIFDQRVCLPISAIQGIMPLHCAISVPCTERWILGLGLRDNRVFTVVCPASKHDSNAVPIDAAKMLLNRPSGSDLNWALRVDQVLGMTSIIVDMTRHHFNEEWMCPGDWFRPAKTSAGDEIVWLDPEAVNFSLARVGGNR